MTDIWQCKNCDKQIPSKAFAKIHQQHWPTHVLLHMISVPDVIDPDEPVTIAEVINNPMHEHEQTSGEEDPDDR